jgi:hypothetical protein
MLGTALYYPYIDINDPAWLRSAILFWDEVQTIVPTSVRNPYHGTDSKICYSEGYLRPLACDLHTDLLEELGRRVIKLFDRPEWQRELIQSRGPPRIALIHADKLGHQMKRNLEDLVGIHLDKMAPAVRHLFIQSGGLKAISTGKLPLDLARSMRNFATLIDPDLEEIWRSRRHRYHDEGEWILVNGRFAQVYMSALAALLAKEVQVSPLTNEEPASGVNLRCLVKDMAASGENAARGALVTIPRQSRGLI